jgi:Mce-associated membrane protein
VGLAVHRWNDDAVSEQEQRRPEAPTWFVALAAAAALLLVASGGAIGWLLQRDSAAAETSEVATDPDVRGELIGVAEQYFVEANTYDFTDVADYKARVHPLMTEQNRRTFDATMQQIAQGFADIEARATGTVRQAAVETVDDDSATVMVTGDAQFDSTRIKRTYFPRWEVALRLVDGEWLVENHTELGDSGLFSTTPGGR